MRKNKYPLISVMIPVHNSEKYLEKCLDSILKQTYRNIELILVNDGSSDNSLSICEAYKKKDNRIKLINKPNEGASQARNAALKNATGDYFGFVDSDDWILPTYFETLLKQSLRNNADISRCQSFTKKDDYNNQMLETKVLKKTEFMPLILTDKISSHLWKNIFKRELFEGVFFPHNYSAHDMMVFHKIANKAKILVETNEKLYFYYEDRPDNMSNNPSGLFKGTVGRAMAFYERYTIAKNEFQEIDQQVLKKSVRFTIASFCRAERHPNDEFQEELFILENFLIKEQDVIEKSNLISKLEKIAVKLIIYNSKAFMKISKHFNL